MAKIRIEAPNEAFIDSKRKNRMAKVDAFDPETRGLVHEYGLAVVQTCRDLGVTKPRHIRHLVEQILDEFSPTRGSYSAQGARSQLSQVEGGTRPNTQTEQERP